MNRPIVTAVVSVGIVVAPAFGTAAASANEDLASKVAFYDAHGDVDRGHDIRRVVVDNDDHLVIKVWHRDLRSTRQYSFRLFLDTDPSSPAPEVKAYGAFPNSDFAACTTTSWSTGATAGCDPEDQLTQCSLDVDVRWDSDVTRFDFTRTAQCLVSASAVGVNVSFEEFHPSDTRWDYALARHVWYPPVPRDT
jgi:hypothetical protein